MVLVLAAVLAAALLATGLATPSPELDTTAPLPWWRWRITHIALGLSVCALALAAAVAHHRHGGLGLDPAAARNMLGLGGLALLTATTAGARLAWTGPFAYTLAAWAIPPSAATWMRIWQWPLLPSHAQLSWWPALALCATGTLAMTLRGPASQPND